eukprot:1187050-Prorocentrum_minimum.AAC.1
MKQVMPCCHRDTARDEDRGQIKHAADSARVSLGLAMDLVRMGRMQVRGPLRVGGQEGVRRGWAARSPAAALGLIKPSCITRESDSPTNSSRTPHARAESCSCNTPMVEALVSLGNVPPCTADCVVRQAMLFIAWADNTMIRCSTGYGVQLFIAWRADNTIRCSTRFQQAMGYFVKFRTVDEKISPQNRILIGAANGRELGVFR